jgi:hypothetical protein
LREVAARALLIAAAAASVVAGVAAGSSVPYAGDGPKPPAQLELAAAGFGVAAVLLAAIPLVEWALRPAVGGCSWRAVLLCGVALGVAVGAVGAPGWAHRPHTATVCERDGVTGKMACSHDQPDFAAQERAEDEYLGGGALICASAAVLALWVCSRARPVRRVGTDRAA